MEPAEVELKKFVSIAEPPATIQEPKPEAAAVGPAPVKPERVRLTDDDDEFLRPGVVVRPNVKEEDAQNLAQRLYGITTMEICELISYEDRNYLIHVDR